MTRRPILLLLLLLLPTPVAWSQEAESLYDTRPGYRSVALGSGIAAGVVISGFAISEEAFWMAAVRDHVEVTPEREIVAITTASLATAIVGMSTSMLGTTTYYKLFNTDAALGESLFLGAVYSFTAATVAHGCTLATAAFTRDIVAGVDLRTAWNDAAEAFIWAPIVGVAGALVGLVTSTIIVLSTP